MTKTDLIDKVAESAEMTKKDAAVAVGAVLDAITDALAKGEKVQLIGFGSFEVRERAARVGHALWNIRYERLRAAALNQGHKLVLCEHDYVRVFSRGRQDAIVQPNAVERAQEHDQTRFGSHRLKRYLILKTDHFRLTFLIVS